MENQQYSVTKQIRSLVENLFARVLRGQYDYEKDSRELERLRDQAQTHDDPMLVARIINVNGVMNMYSGHLNNALEQFQKNYDIYREAQSIGGMTEAINNLALTHAMMGHHDQAVTVYDQGLDLANEFAGTMASHEIPNYGLILSGKLISQVALRRFEEARQTYDGLWNIASELVVVDRGTYARVMVEGYRGKAELDLDEGQVDEARSAIGLALELAQSLDLHFEVAKCRLVQAHIARLGDDDTDQADAFWQQAEALVSATPIAFNTGYVFAEEAQYLIHAGLDQEAEHFGQKAIDFLGKTQTPEVEQMIESLSAMLPR